MENASSCCINDVTNEPDLSLEVNMSNVKLGFAAGVLSAIIAFGFVLSAGAEPTPESAEQALYRAASFYHSIATNGGYVGLISPDLTKRFGEATYEEASENEIWVQPPGTPTVGEVYLDAYRLTGDSLFLDYAVDAALALAWGQRKEGGWDHRVDVGHVVPGHSPVRQSGNCTFDDDITQGAVTFLMNLDREIDEEWLTSSISRALSFIMAAQFLNGAWPQWYPLIGGYHDYYTYNDNAINDCIRVMLAAHSQYDNHAYLASALAGGKFILASRLSEDQPVWAQQYSHDMKPAWARTFEPPGIDTAVSASNIRTLINLYLYTGEDTYLEPIPYAIDWFERSKLSDNRWARLYEAGTNRPIYGDRDSKVHYTLDEISEERRSGYGWQGSWASSAVTAYKLLMDLGADEYRRERARELSDDELRNAMDAITGAAEEAMSMLDPEGRWVDRESGMIRSRDFVENIRAIIRYLKAQERIQ